MSFVTRSTVTFTTSAGGAAEVFSDVMNGGLYTIRYTYGNADTGADFTITTEDTQQPIVTITNAGTSSTQWQPRQALHDSAGAAIAGEYCMVGVAGERIKIVIAQGGNAKTGTFEIVVV